MNLNLRVSPLPVGLELDSRPSLKLGQTAPPIHDGLQLSEVETICEIIMGLRQGKGGP
jgi:hypothetical protein